MIKSFKDAVTETVFDGECPKGFPYQIVSAARRKLKLVNAAKVMDDLRSPPGNRLEKLSGNRAGQHSIRVNDQFRVCFKWTDGGPEEVEICDYH